jgi:predicted flap endonuclease-1-like 5' DNA nuclease
MQFLAGNLWLVLAGIAIFTLLAGWLVLGGRRTRVETSRLDALDEGGERARRNRALIDAPERPAAAPTPPPAAPIGGDDLTRIKGLGPRLAALLNALGVNSYAEIAAWSEDEIDRIDAQLGTFAGRIRRDNWLEQAKFLANDDMAGFEGKFGKL